MEYQFSGMCLRKQQMHINTDIKPEELQWWGSILDKAKAIGTELHYNGYYFYDTQCT